MENRFIRIVTVVTLIDRKICMPCTERRCKVCNVYELVRELQDMHDKTKLTEILVNLDEGGNLKMSSKKESDIIDANIFKKGYSKARVVGELDELIDDLSRDCIIHLIEAHDMVNRWTGLDMKQEFFLGTLKGKLTEME